MKRLFLVAIALVLTGCAAPRLSQQADQRIKTVGIVSLVPENANFTKIGLTVFNNEYAEIQMGGKINATIESSVAQRLAAVRPQWQIKPVEYPRVEWTQNLYATGFFAGSQRDRVTSDVAALARANQLDAVVLVSKYRPENAHGDGVGVLLRTLSLSSVGDAYVTSYLSASLLDPQGEVLASSWGDRQMPPKVIDPKAYGIQYKLADNNDPALQDRLRKDVVDQVAKVVEDLVKRLGL
jgi:hypothetical protein